MTAAAPALELRDLRVSYGSIAALHGISLVVTHGSIVALIGANGAGKSTTLRTISGLVRATSGSVCFLEKDITNRPAHEIVRAGIAHVPEGRMIFPQLSVWENLTMGAYTSRDRKVTEERREEVFSLFPRLKERHSQSAGTLSGGEQQMLAIGRALMSGANFLMLDEPSLGIAPILVETIFERLLEIRRQRNLTLLLVEQNASLALEIADMAYVLETGHVAISGPPAQLSEDPRVRAAYLGG